MRIGKPLLITTTAVGLVIGIYEAFRLTGRLGWMVVAFVGLFAAAMGWVVRVARAEKRADR